MADAKPAPVPTPAMIEIAGEIDGLAEKIAISAENPYAFAEGVTWTDKDCA
jgi:hypothetical protein